MAPQFVTQVFDTFIDGRARPTVYHQTETEARTYAAEYSGRTRSEVLVNRVDGSPVAKYEKGAAV